MTDRIGHPGPMAVPARAAPKPQPAGPLDESCDFGSELRRNRVAAANPVESEPRTSEPADFLGTGTRQSSGESAKIFNADGFFAKLQAALGPPRDPQRPGLLDQRPTRADLSLALETAVRLPLPFRPTSDARGGGANPSGSNRQGEPRSAGHVRHRGPMAAGPGFQAAPGEPAPQSVGPAELWQAQDAAPGASIGDGAGVQGANEVFRLWLEGDSIHVVGPLEGLSSDDEAELRERVAELLSRHGFGISGLSINGRAFILPPNRE